MKYVACAAAGFVVLLALQDRDRGREIFESRCASCHFIPDRTIRADQIWLELVATTPWGGTSADGRSAEKKALLAYLGSKDVRTALRFDEETKPDPSLRTGSLRVSFEEGTLLLESTEGSGLIRPVWKKGNLDRKIPVGRYRVRNFSIEKKLRGETWTLLAAGKRGEIVEVREGEMTELKIDDRIHGRPSVRTRSGKVVLALGLSGESQMGLTLVRDRNQVPARYTLRDAKEKEVQSGLLPYVWGGSCRAEVRPKKEIRSLHIQMETGPFEYVGDRAVSLP